MIIVTCSRTGDLVDFIIAYCSGGGNTCGQVFDEVCGGLVCQSYNVIVRYE
jgi:hypothetical protein